MSPRPSSIVRRIKHGQTYTPAPVTDPPPPPDPTPTFKQGAFGNSNAHLASSVATWASVTSTTPRMGMAYTYEPKDNFFLDTNLDGWATWLASNSGNRLAFSVRLISTDISRQWTNTRDDAKHTTFAAKFASRGMTSKTIIRLGWEMNGNWYPWGAVNQDDPTTSAAAAGYITAFQRIAPIYQAQGMRINWCPRWFLTNTSSWYPGDDYVDIVGMDRYDNWLSGTAAQRWTSQKAHFDRQLAFARLHEKTVSLDEWGCTGLTTASGTGGGDSPYYINAVADYIEANSDVYEYATYFNNDDGGAANSIITRYPNALAAYTSRFAGYTT